MGCHGSKTAQSSNPVEHQAADTTLLKEPVADNQIVKPQESGFETPQALAKETVMDATQAATAAEIDALLDDSKNGATQDAETSKAVKTEGAETSKVAETSAAQDATALKAAQAPLLPGAMASKAEEAPAIDEGATSNDVETPAEIEAAGATLPDAADQPSEGVDEVNGGKQIPKAEALEQKPVSQGEQVEAGAAKTTPEQDVADEGASAEQTKAAGLAVPKVVANLTATTKPVAINTQGGCCSRYCLATEVQSEIVAHKD